MNKTEKLIKASFTALKDYMGLKPEEILLIVTDETKKEIAGALHSAGKKLCKESFLVEMKSREINGQEPPKQISDLMKSVDVVICPTEKSLTHTNARREASALGVRVATMPGISIETMLRCLNADADRIIKLTKTIAQKLSVTSEIRVVSETGTDEIFSKAQAYCEIKAKAGTCLREKYISLRGKINPMAWSLLTVQWRE
jgi:aminopeptidase